MAFNNIAVCILINSTPSSLFSFSATKLTFAKKSKQSMDTYTKEKSTASRDSLLNSVLHKRDCN